MIECVLFAVFVKGIQDIVQALVYDLAAAEHGTPELELIEA